MKAIVLVSVIALSGACGGSREKDAYAALAHKINPILATMKPAVRRLFSTMPPPNTLIGERTQAEQIVAACESVDEALWSLRTVDLSRFQPDITVSTVADWAAWLLDHRASQCEHGTPQVIFVCASWCSSDWMALIQEAERLRGEARKYGVEITSLRE